MPIETTKTRKNLLGRKVTVTKKQYSNAKTTVNDKTREVYNPKTGVTKTKVKINRKRSEGNDIVSDKERAKTITNAKGGSTSRSRWTEKRTPKSGPLKNKASKVVTREKQTISNPDADFYGTANRSVKVRSKVKGQKAEKEKGNYTKKQYNAGASFKSVYGY